MPAPRTGGPWTASCTDGGRCSSFLVARFNVRDRDHRAAIEFLEAQKGAGPDAFRLVFSDYVYDETVTALVVRSKPRSRLGRGPSNPGVEEPAPR